MDLRTLILVFEPIIIFLHLGSTSETLCSDIPILQGVQDQKLLFQLAVTLEWSKLDLMLVKPKCVWAIYNSYTRF